MSKIIAKYGERKITVEENDGKITVCVDGCESPWWKLILDELCNHLDPVGGTFYPQKETMLGYYFALRDGYLGDELKLEVEDDIGTIPYEEGKIY